MKIIEVNNLSKSYGKTAAVKNLNFSIDKNELFGFIGPDGAGKTTLFRIIITLLLPDSGSVTVLGFDVIKDYKKIREKVGYMPGRFSLYQDLSVEENLRFFASIFGTTIEENYDLIKDIYRQIEPFKKRKAGQLSGGMKQKLALSCALIHKPELLVLDEPTTGVDAVSRKEFWEMLKNLKQQGITIIVSTPYMDEANLCDRIALIQSGSILKIDTPERIAGEFKKELFAIRSIDKNSLIKVLNDYQFANSVHTFGDALHYTDKRELINIDEIINYLHGKNISDVEVNRIVPGIEDAFIALMREQSDE